MKIKEIVEAAQTQKDPNLSGGFGSALQGIAGAIKQGAGSNISTGAVVPTSDWHAWTRTKGFGKQFVKTLNPKYQGDDDDNQFNNFNRPTQIQRKNTVSVPDSSGRQTVYTRDARGNWYDPSGTLVNQNNTIGQRLHAILNQLGGWSR